MRKPRTAKAAVNLWLIDNSDRLGLKPADVARRIDVSETTVRGWEAGRSVGAGSLYKLEQLFGTEAPVPHDTPGDIAALVDAITDLVSELRQTRLEQAEWNAGVQEVVRALAARLAPAQPTNGPEPALPEGAPR